MPQQCHKSGVAISALTTRVAASKVMQAPWRSVLHADYHADVHIWAPKSSTPVPLSQDSKLHFLSLVEISRIPLYLAAGPSCEVSTENDATTRWLTEALLVYEAPDLYGDTSLEPWWSHLGRQSESGILLMVQSENNQERGIPNVVTEILLYAAVTKTEIALPTTLASSSPAHPGGDLADSLEGGRTVKVYALPLCSLIIGRVANPTDVSLQSPMNIRPGEACFLPRIHSALTMQPAPQKRQSISTIFDDATKKRRKFKGRGGESISQAMAGIDRLPSQQGLPEKQGTPQPPQHDLRRKSLSRASSMTLVAGPEYPRPTSRSGPLTNGKRSSLHQVESVISPRDSPMPIDADSSNAQQNKAALTKVIMAAMRLYGLQQKKRPASKSQLLSQVTSHTETNGAANEEAEDEYKLVYHQTYKAAMFTFRKHLNALLISQETMRDVVDQLLTMFCTDPMIVDGLPDSSEIEGLDANNGLPSSSPFDKPSSEAQSSSVAICWSTPTGKKD